MSCDQPIRGQYTHYPPIRGQINQRTGLNAINHDENLSVVTITAIIGRIKFMFSIKVWPIEIRKGGLLFADVVSILSPAYFLLM